MELIKETKTQRYYQLNFDIHHCFGPSKTIKELFASDKINLLDDYELAENISKSINKICISDAHTHIERLVFPAFNVREKKTGKIILSHRCNQIDGYVTFMTRGGDSLSVHPDEVYVRHLRMKQLKEKEMK